MRKIYKSSPKNKKEYIKEIGKLLVTEYGKKRYYKPGELKNVHWKSKWQNAIDYSVWGMCVFSSHTDFDNYNKKKNGDGDYFEMKAEMLEGISSSVLENWTELPSVDLDASWLDFGEIFEGILEGIGDLLGSIFEGIS